MAFTFTQVLIRRSQAWIKDIIVRNAAKFTAGEVEAVLSLHPDVKSAAVIGVPDESEGEVPVAFVLAEEARAPRFLETRIARYKIPARYYFVAPLPLTRGGKIDREALRTKAVAGKVR